MEVKTANKIKMYRTVQSVCTDYETAWNTVPAFVAAYDRFNLRVIELDQLIFAQTSATLGVRKVKDEEREATANRAHKLASALRALATETGNTALMAQFKFSHSDLLYGGNETVLQYMLRVRDAAVQEETALADFGITTTHIQDYITHLDQLIVAFGTTRSAIVNRSKNTQFIKDAIRDIDKILKMSLDPIMEVLKENNPDFALSYEKAREVVDLHGKKHKSGNDDVPPLK